MKKNIRIKIETIRVKIQNREDEIVKANMMMERVIIKNEIFTNNNGNLEMIIEVRPQEKMVQELQRNKIANQTVTES